MYTDISLLNVYHSFSNRRRRRRKIPTNTLNSFDLYLLNVVTTHSSSLLLFCGLVNKEKNEEWDHVEAINSNNVHMFLYLYVMNWYRCGTGIIVWIIQDNNRENKNCAFKNYRIFYFGYRWICLFWILNSHLLHSFIRYMCVCVYACAFWYGDIANRINQLEFILSVISTKRFARLSFVFCEKK